MTSTSVIVPHFNDLQGLERCLAALDRQTLPRSEFEIIVADNNSPQGLAAVEAVVGGRARVVLAPERGAGPARNRGVLASSCERLAFIDSDCVAEPQWLASGLAGLASFDFCGGPVRVLIDHDGPLSAAEAFEVVFAFDNESYIHKKGFTGSGNLFTLRRVFDDVGGFGVGLSEDLDWSHRARAKGYRLGYVADAAIGHPARTTWAQLRAKWLRIQSETFGLRPPNLANRLRWLARTWALPLSILAHTPKVLACPRLTTTADRLAAIRGLALVRLWRFWDSHRLLFGVKRG